MTLSMLVLPAPLRPMRPTLSPGWMVKDAPTSVSTPPTSTDRSTTRSTAQVWWLPDPTMQSISPADENDGVPARKQPAPEAPLAARMRPTTLDEIVGQHHLVGPGAPLRALIETDRLS